MTAIENLCESIGVLLSALLSDLASLDHGLLEHGHVALAGLDGGADRRVVLRSRIALRDRGTPVPAVGGARLAAVKSWFVPIGAERGAHDLRQPTTYAEALACS